MHEALGQDAASVARLLLDFLREPARHRPRYAQGRAALPAGHHLFRFAQGRFPHGLLRDLAKADRDRVRQAAHDFIRQVCFRDDATHYHVLCVPADASRDAIKENYHLLIALIHPDRQDSAAEAWPTHFAQRVNQAYAVLADEFARAKYDAGLRHREERPAFEADAATRAGIAAMRRPRTHRERAGLRFARALIVLTTVVATLMLLEVWVSDEGGEHSLLRDTLARLRTQGALASTELPRFIGMEPLPAPSRADALAPAPKVPPRAPAPIAVEAPAVPPPAPRADIPLPALKGSEAPSLFQAGAAPLAAPDLVAPPGEARLTSQDVENMVVRLVGFYEAGETDKLMALLDSRAAGYWKTARTRQAYADFFGATRQRRLRVDNLAWQTEPGAARAKGVATIVAEYFDSHATLERRIDLELDIALRDGGPKITRLTLFPDSP